MSGRLVFLKALQPSCDEGDDLATPFEVTLTLTGNLPSPFSGSAVRIENPEPPEAMFLFDFPQVHVEIEVWVPPGFIDLLGLQPKVIAAGRRAKCLDLDYARRLTRSAGLCAL